jgi:hypothetical protein
VVGLDAGMVIVALTFHETVRLVMTTPGGTNTFHVAVRVMLTGDLTNHVVDRVAAGVIAVSTAQVVERVGVTC